MHRFRIVLPLLTLSLLIAGGSEAAQPQGITVSPAASSGNSQTFTLTASDSDGAADVSGMNLLIGGQALNGSNACWIYFDHAHRTAWLADDSGLQWSNIDLSSGSRVQNSQCSVAFVGNQDSGDSASVAFNVQFTGAESTLLYIWGRAGDSAGDDSGYQNVGQFQFVPPTGPDFTVSVTPSSQTVSAGNRAIYNFTITSVNGLSGVVNNSFSYSGSSTLDAAANPPAGPVILPAGGSVTASFQVTTGTDTPPGTLNVTDTFSVGGTLHTAQVALGVDPATMPDISVSPSSGAGGAQTFTITASDPAGYQAIQGFHLLISSSFDTRNSCWIYFEPARGGPGVRGPLSLASDDTTTWTTLAPTVIGGSVQNSQCAVLGAQLTATAGGNSVTLSLPLSFTPAFSGNKVVYGEVSDIQGTTTGYQPRGSFAVSGGTAGQPDFQLSFAWTNTQPIPPGSSWLDVVIVTRMNGFAGTVDFTVTGTIPNATITPPRPIDNTPGASSSIGIATTSSTPPGVYRLTITGTSGALSHLIQLVVTVLDPTLPQLTMLPSSGSGSPATLTFNASNTNTEPAVTGMSVLFANSVDGRDACWIYWDGSQIWLASDDTLLWSHTDADTTSVGNSQCTVTLLPGNQSAAGLGATFTFQTGFTGTRNVYMDAGTSAGRDTGYQQVGTWTLP